MNAHWEAMEMLHPVPRLNWPLPPANSLDVDTRVKCTDCAGLRGGACVRPREAGLCGDRPVEMGTVATLPQHCPGFVHVDEDTQARAILRLPISERRETLARLQAQHGPEYVGRLKARITAIWEASRCA